MKGKIAYVNRIPERFAEHEKYVKDGIEHFFDLLELNCELKVEFVDSIDQNTFEIADCALVSTSVKKHKLMITNFVLNSISRDGGDYFQLAIYHEFLHLKDYVNLMQTKCFDFLIDARFQKTYERQYIHFGYNFWTEFYAYYNTIDAANENDIAYEKIPFGRLVKNYRRTKKMNEKLFYKKDLTQDEADGYVDAVDSFVYLCAKFMASSYVGHSRIPHAKIDKDKDYGKVFRILSGLEPKIRRMGRDPYEPKTYANLLRLGKYICEDVRWKVFMVGLGKYKGMVHSII